jgi:hypothetical protein
VLIVLTVVWPILRTTLHNGRGKNQERSGACVNFSSVPGFLRVEAAPRSLLSQYCRKMRPRYCLHFCRSRENVQLAHSQHVHGILSKLDCDEVSTHHLVILMLKHVTVPNVLSGIAFKLYNDARYGHGIDSNSILPSEFVCAERSQYTSFREITDDISDARVYGGIHFRTDQAAGARLGRAVGRAVYKNNLRAVHDHDWDDDWMMTE